MTRHSVAWLGGSDGCALVNDGGGGVGGKPAAVRMGEDFGPEGERCGRWVDEGGRAYMRISVLNMLLHTVLLVLEEFFRYTLGFLVFTFPVVGVAYYAGFCSRHGFLRLETDDQPCGAWR